MCCVLEWTSDLCVFDVLLPLLVFFFFSSRRRHTRSDRDWSSDVCSSDLFLLSFAANVLVAVFLALIGVVFAKKAKKSKGPQKVAASMKETAGVLQKAKPHPRPEQPQTPALEDRAPAAIEAVARSSS